MEWFVGQTFRPTEQGPDVDSTPTFREQGYGDWYTAFSVLDKKITEWAELEDSLREEGDPVSSVDCWTSLRDEDDPPLEGHTYQVCLPCANGQWASWYIDESRNG
jgi:hypothetical protein